MRKWVWSSVREAAVLVYDRQWRDRAVEVDAALVAAKRRAEQREYADYVEHAGSYQQFLAGGGGRAYL